MKGGTGAMTGTRSKLTGKRVTASPDLAAYARLMAEDNGQELDQLRRNLAMALREDVTPRQRQVLLLYYGQGLSMQEIAQELGIDRSTVSRTMGRGEERLRRCLRYGGAALLKQEPLEKGQRRRRPPRGGESGGVFRP